MLSTYRPNFFLHKKEKKPYLPTLFFKTMLPETNTFFLGLRDIREVMARFWKKWLHKKCLPLE